MLGGWQIKHGQGPPFKITIPAHVLYVGKTPLFMERLFMGRPVG